MSADLIPLRPLEHSSVKNLWDWWMLWGSDQWCPLRLPLPLHRRELLSEFTCRVAQIQLLIKEEMENNRADVQGEAKSQQPLIFISWDRIPGDSEVCKGETWGAEDGEPSPGLRPHTRCSVQLQSVILALESKTKLCLWLGLSDFVALSCGCFQDLGNGFL